MCEDRAGFGAVGHPELTSGEILFCKDYLFFLCFYKIALTNGIGWRLRVAEKVRRELEKIADYAASASAILTIFDKTIQSAHILLR